MPCATYTDNSLQNAYWERFTQAKEVTNLFIWNFHGELIHAAIEFPGSWHDSKVAACSVLYEPLLQDCSSPGFAVLADSAFPRIAPEIEGKRMRARKANEYTAANGIFKNPCLSTVDVLLQRVMPSERQSVEWV